uniref:C2H2-type domain-containing protein n=1 Tax=Haemonchus contortus TaxID=6289 RepID=A0A7I4YZI7_HAECO
NVTDIDTKTSMVYILVDLENQAQLSDVVTFLLSRSYNVFHVNNDNPCPKCSMRENRNTARTPSLPVVEPPQSATVEVANLSTPCSSQSPVPIERPSRHSQTSSPPSEGSQYSPISLTGPEFHTELTVATSSMEPIIRYDEPEPPPSTSNNTSNNSLPLFSFDRVELKPEVSIMNRSFDSWFTSGNMGRRERRKSEELPDARPSTMKSLKSLSKSQDFNDATEAEMWASTSKLIKKQNLGNTAHCRRCKWSVQANLVRIRKHVNNVHMRFNRFRCNYCSEKFVHQTKAERHQRSQHFGRNIPIIRLPWTLEEKFEIEKTMIECFGFVV